jgi:L-asparaginase II
MAHAFARLPDLPHAGRVTAAMRAHPHLIGAADGADVVLMQRSESYVAKGGAEGLLLATDLATRTGWAFKAEDGAARALAPAVAAVLGVDALARVPVRDTRGEVVGELALQSPNA